MVAFVHPVRRDSASKDARGSGWTRSTWSSRMTRGHSSHSGTSRTGIGSRFGSRSPAITVHDAWSTTTLQPTEVNACKRWCVMAPDGLRGFRPTLLRVPTLRHGSLAPARVSQRETKDVAWGAICARGRLKPRPHRPLDRCMKTADSPSFLPLRAIRRPIHRSRSKSSSTRTPPSTSCLPVNGDDP